MKVFALIPAVALAAGFAVASPSFAATNDTTVSLAQLVADADTPSEHAEVAKQYRTRATELSAKAEKHEAEVKRLQSRRQPLDVKNPTLSDRKLAKERQAAMEARRGAREATELAMHHTQLAVELMASR